MGPDTPWRAEAVFIRVDFHVPGVPVHLAHFPDWLTSRPAVQLLACWMLDGDLTHFGLVPLALGLDATGFALVQPLG